jgi:hypothetical protein
MGEKRAPGEDPPFIKGHHAVDNKLAGPMQVNEQAANPRTLWK